MAHNWVQDYEMGSYECVLVHPDCGTYIDACNGCGIRVTRRLLEDSGIVRLGYADGSVNPMIRSLLEAMVREGFCYAATPRFFPE